MTLTREGYSDAQSQLSGDSIRGDLRRAMKAASAERPMVGAAATSARQ
jgi:hypothetical protein